MLNYTTQNNMFTTFDIINHMFIGLV